MCDGCTPVVVSSNDYFIKHVTNGFVPDKERAHDIVLY